MISRMTACQTRSKPPHSQRVWRVFYTRPRAEFQCESRVRNREIETFVLKREVLHQWKDRTKRVTEPVFSGYMFARVHERERLDVLQTDGIVRCVSFGPALAEVPEDEMERLQLAQLDPRRLALYELQLPIKGTRVVVTHGPMAGLTGDVLEHRGESYLVVRIDSIGRALRINIPAEWVRPVEPAELR